MRLPISLPAAIEVLRERTFARYLTAISVSTLGNGMAQLALAFAVLDFGGATDLGIVLLAREIPTILFLLLGGVFADRISRRTILVSTELVKAAAQAVTAILLFMGTANVLNVALLQVVFGVAAAFSRPVSIGLIREAVSDAHLQQANALAGLSRSTLYIVGPAVGAIIVTAGSPALAIGIDATTFLISAGLIASMQLAPSIRMVTTSILGDLRGGWREFVSRPWVVAMVISFGLFQLSYFPPFFVLGPTVAKDELGGAAAWGLILSASAAGAVIGGLLALRVRIERPLIASELAVVPAGVLLAAIAIPLPVLAIAAVSLVSGAGFAFGGTMWETALQRNVPNHALSRISSFDWLGSVALNPLGYALIGPLAALIGTPETLAIAAVFNIATCVGVVLLPSVRAIRMHPQTPSTRATS